MSEADPNTVEREGGPGPGDRLQAARVSIGMTLEEVAAKMHLSPTILSNLEENDFDEITAPIFVKGYLRSYARIVRLDEDDIIQQYARYHAGGDPPIGTTSNTAREINAGDVRVRGVTWIVILILLGLLVLWWWNRYQQPTQTVSLDSSQPSTTLDKPVESVLEPAATVEISQNRVSETIETTETTAEEAVAEQSVSSVVEAAEPVNNAPASSEPAAADTPATSEAPAEQTEATQEESSIAETATDAGLVIVVKADTWTDIRDADGKKLVYDLLRAGQRVEVDGKTPINAFLGNAKGVEILYRGENIDLSRLIRADNTARVRIGQ